MEAESTFVVALSRTKVVDRYRGGGVVPVPMNDNHGINDCNTHCESKEIEVGESQ